MRNKWFVLLLMLLSSQLLAQENEHKNILRVSPLGAFNKARVHYERSMNINESYGLMFSYYYTYYNGPKVDLFYKVYTSHNNPNGFYVQLKLSTSYISMPNATCTWTETYDDSTGVLLEKSDEQRNGGIMNFFSFGGGLSLGFQHTLGKKERFLIDCNLGAQYFPLYHQNGTREEYYDSDGNRVVEITSYNCGREGPSEVFFWFFAGPGSIFSSSISFGYRF